MRKLLLLIFIPLSMMMYGQDSIVTSPTGDIVNVTEAERIIDKYTGKLYDGVADITERLSGPAEEVFGYVVMLQIAKGIGMLSPLLFLFIFLFIGYVYLNKGLKADFKNKGEAYGIVGVVSLVVAAIFFIIGIFSVYAGLLHLIAPEWYAIEEIIGLIK